jgi:hypothetical protein
VKPLPLGSQVQSLIEAHERQRRGVALAGRQSGSELQGIGRPKVVDAKEPHRRAADGFDRLHLVPLLAQCAQLADRGRDSGGVERPFSFQPRERRDAFGGRAPPGDDSGSAS